ncbi:MAG: hypothetical protein KAJ19_20535 [Gammaproteobacteria bacterium]|nr:hypothetical protein [Gammaproteobacteria bacterium]
MIDQNIWIDNIKEILLILSDKEMQKKIWFLGDFENQSSWGEVMCQLFDDFAIELFSKQEWVKKISKDLPIRINELIYKLELFKKEDYFGDDLKILIESKEWSEVYLLSQKIIKILET